ncbi:lamin tail domain-containing protein 2 isoform X2 [Suricata suricatta]|uniref:lamin tail domain-containing protein 2 isoform X2 n=1 Tax=Suricata suricatta TaxID=37032 RepID=UPI001156A6AA|nr:lamin tail domain-containing protein 2 isoform X2 [Suricata suricatta]
MAPEPCQEPEKAKKEAPLSLVDQELVSGHPEPPADTPKDPVAPACLPDTKPSSTPAVFSINLQLAPESLDPRTLQLLWGQRELEIQALRWTIHNRRDARHCHILYEVAGLPAERSSCSQEKFLQNQVQKLTLELKEQKEQAQLDKSQLEERLQQAVNTIQRLETELQAFQRSCLLQLDGSSWVGRVLRSCTGSVEVVTAETLMDSSDLSENDQVPSTKEGFQPKDADWNNIAQRAPSLLSNIKSNSDQKPTSDQWGSELHGEHVERHLKSVEWSSLPFVDTSSSGGTGSDSSSGRPAAPYPMRKVTRRPPCTPGRGSELTEPHWRSLRSEMQAQPEGLPLDPWNRPSKVVLTREFCVESELGHRRQHLHGSPPSSCLKIVAVSSKERYVRILNQSLEETANLGGLTLRQLLHGFPVCMYRFPPGTRLEPRRHVTVWGEGPASTKQPPPSSSGREPVHFHSSRGCVTLLLNPKGEVRVLSEHPAPHCVTPVPRIFADNTDLSIDCFPLSEAGLRANPREQRRGPEHSRAGRDAGPLTAAEQQQALPPARGASAARGSHAGAPARLARGQAAPAGRRSQEGARGPAERAPMGGGGLPAPPPRRSGPAPPGVPEERGPGLPDGSAVGAEHCREQIRLPLPPLPAAHRGTKHSGVGGSARAGAQGRGAALGESRGRPAVPSAQFIEPTSPTK